MIAAPEQSSPPSDFATSVDRVTEAEWNSLLPRFADASIYQTWAYGAVCWGEKQLSHLVLRRGANVVAAAQLRVVRIPVLNRGIAYLRWGPLWRLKADTPASQVLDAMLESLCREYVDRRGLLLRLLPNVFREDSETPSYVSSFSRYGLEPEADSAPYRTIRVDLTASLETIRRRLDGKWRNQLNGAERNGLTVSEGTDDGLYRQFLELYEEMMARKQFETTVDVREFRQLQERLPEGQKMYIMISAKDGVPQTGLVATALGNTGIYLLGATSNEGMKSKGSYLLQWQMMQRLRDHGCRWYDLGGINPDSNPGVYHFKQGMGGNEVAGIGRFELRGSWLSTCCVQFAEKLQQIRQRSRTRTTPTRPASAGCAR